MKKISLLFTLAGCLSLQAFGQVATPALHSRSGVSEVRTATNANSFVNGVPVSPNSNALKGGGTPSAQVAFLDDFSLPNDTNGLKARGYLPYYRGTGPQGVTGAWFQGNANNWTDFNTGTNQFVMSNYQSVTGTNDIDNWLVLPALNITIGDVISFYSRSPLGSTFPDSIRVMYSAVGDSTPEATTWVQLGNFKVNTAGAWMQDQFVAPADGATARFAIRYSVVDGGPNGVNSDLIGIDQLEVFTPSAFDLEAVAASPINSEYTMVPLDQAAGTILNASVKNNGLNATTGGSALFEVIDTVTAGIVFSESVVLPSITPGSTTVINTTNSFNPATPANLRTRVTLTYPGDGNPANDIMSSTVTAITDSVFARDNGNVTGSLGIGAGAGSDGILGQSFTVTNATDLTAISYFMSENLDPNPAGTPVYATIHAQPLGFNPDATVLATTTTITFTPGMVPAGGDWYTVPLNGPSLALAPGQYFVGLHEVDSTVALGTADEIITPGTVWVSWNTIPSPPAVNGWATVEDFQISATYMLRMIFGTPTGINEVDANSALINVYPSPASTELTINLDKSITNAQVAIYNSLGMLIQSNANVNGNLKMDVSAFAKGIYTVKVSSNGNEFTQRFTVIR